LIEEKNDLLKSKTFYAKYTDEQSDCLKFSFAIRLPDMIFQIHYLKNL